METGVMSESLVVPSDVHQTVTEVLGQHVLDGFEQTDITVKLLQEQVELNLGYSEGSLTSTSSEVGRSAGPGDGGVGGSHSGGGSSGRS